MGYIEVLFLIKGSQVTGKRNIEKNPEKQGVDANCQECRCLRTSGTDLISAKIVFTV